MVESGIFSLDIEEALKVTDSDLEETNPNIAQIGMEFTLIDQDDSSWPNRSNQENGQLRSIAELSPEMDPGYHQPCRSDLAVTSTHHETPKPGCKRFVRPGSAEKASPGFIYSRPDIKIPDQRRNLGGKIHDPAAKKSQMAETDVNQSLVVPHQNKPIAAGVVSSEEVRREAQSSLRLAVLSSLRTVSPTPEVTTEQQHERFNERDSRKAVENVEKRVSPGELKPLPFEASKPPSTEPSMRIYAASTHSPLQSSKQVAGPKTPYGNQSSSRASTPMEPYHPQMTSKTASHQKPTRPMIRESSSHVSPSVLKPQEAGRIEKRKTRRQIHEPSVRPIAGNCRYVPDQVEILQLLAFRAKQERDAQQAMARELEAQRKQSEQTKAQCLELETQLNQGLEREHTQKVDLEKFKSLLSGLKGKAKKLDDYVKGLSNDHNKLRDDAINLRQQQESLKDDRRVIQIAIADTRDSLQHITRLDKGAIGEARLQLGNLQKVINQQHGQLMDKSDLLDTERKRLRVLEGELVRLATSQERMADAARNDQKDLLNGIHTILDQHQKLSQAQGVGNAIPHGALKRCVELLEQIHARNHITPEELHRLDESVQAQIQSIVTVVEDRNEELGSHHEIETNFLGRFDSMIAGFKSQENLVEKAAQLREVESILRERTKAHESLLAALRQQITDLHDRESSHLQSISTLQAKLNIPIATIENPRLSQQINELDSQNRGLQQEVISLRSTIESLKEQTNSQDEKLVEAAGNIRQGEAAVEEVKALTAKMDQVKAEFEAEAVTEHEKLRQELSKASMEEKKLITREHANTLHQLQRQLSVSRDSNVKVEGKLKEAVRAQEEQTQVSDSLRARVRQHDYEKRENEKSINHLERQLQEATQNGLSKDAEIQNLAETKAALHKRKGEAEAQKEEAAHHLASQISDMASKHTEILKQINAICARSDPALQPVTSIENALAALARQVDSLRDDSQSTYVATQRRSQDHSQDTSQELLFSSGSDQTPRNPRSNDLEDVALIYQDRNTQNHVANSLTKSTPQVTRSPALPQLKRTPHGERVQESHVEETTTVRSVKRMTSTHDYAEPRIHAGSPSKRREAAPALTSFADLHANMDISTQDSPALENMKDFFPPTPLPPAWPQSNAQPPQSLSKSTPTVSSANQVREIPSILRRPTSSVIRGDLGTSPTPIQSTRVRSKTRVEASSSKTRTTLETRETVKELAAPKSILKPSRTSKRTATDASLEAASQPGRKRSGTLASGSGPVLSSQSRESQGGTMPKVTGKYKGTARRGSRTDKYQERFTKGV